jgi:hypothetical protein
MSDNRIVQLQYHSLAGRDERRRILRGTIISVVCMRLHKEHTGLYSKYCFPVSRRRHHIRNDGRTLQVTKKLFLETLMKPT